MKLRRRFLSFVATAVVVSLPLLAVSGVASAKAKASGCHKTHSCKSGGGGTTGSGTGADPAPITVQIDPNPLVETGQSDVVATVQVETSPAFAGDPVTIASSQLFAACEGEVDFESFQANADGSDSIEVTLDDDGNATVLALGEDCAPGPSVFEADLAVAPYDTALGTLVANPPVVTAAGVLGYPTTSGIVTTGEVETGDTSGLGLGTTPVTLFSSSTPGFTDSLLTAVPPTICAVTITASGGQGGDTLDAPGGDAASVTATVPVTPGSPLDVEVGGAGASDGAGGIGGGGGGGGGSFAGGGGGASAVSSSSTPLVVAGGGGGGSTTQEGVASGGAAGTLGSPGATGGAALGDGGSGGSSSGDGGYGGGGDAGGGGGVAINGGGATLFAGPGGGGNGSVGGGGGGADPGTGGGVGGAPGQTGISGAGDDSGGVGDDSGGNGGTSAFGGGGGGGVGFGGGGGGSFLDGGGGAGYGGGGGGAGGAAGGGGGSSYVTASVIGTPTSSNTSTGNGSVTITYDPATDSCPGASDISDVYAVFYVETSPVYAEQPVEISSPELQSRCGTFSTFATPTGLTTTLDDDGNAVFLFLGSSCAAGSSVVTADVEAGSHPTYTTTFNIVAPQPTI